MSTGRTCDGYGIWGGGGPPQQQNLTVAHSRSVPVPVPVPVRVPFSAPALRLPPSLFAGIKIHDKFIFDWYTCQAAPKLRGGYLIEFWESLVPQASLTEPAILHAVLALAGVHKNGLETLTGSSSENAEPFVLQQLGRSMTQLSTKSSTQDQASIRITLIACCVFVALDFLRGHIETAQLHLRKGVNILRELQMSSDDPEWPSSPQSPTLDTCIFDMFARLQFQAELFRCTFSHEIVVLLPSRVGTASYTIDSTRQSWRWLEDILGRIFILLQQSRDTPSTDPPSSRRNMMLSHSQQVLQLELDEWQEQQVAFERSRLQEVSQGSTSPQLGLDRLISSHGVHKVTILFRLQRLYHTVATILNHTCLHPDDEMAYDAYFELFHSLIAQLAILGPFFFPDERPNDFPEGVVDYSRCTLDLGWTCPLYLLILKCRNLRIRMQALALMQLFHHREGIFDVNALAKVAKKVIEIEHGGDKTYEDLKEELGPFDIFAVPKVEECISETVVESHVRLSGVEVVMEGAPMERIRLFCRRRPEMRRELVSTYDMGRRRWEDEAAD